MSCKYEAGLNRCNALTVDKCQGYERCPFYRTEEQAAESQKKANKRLRSLPDTAQKSIADTYYRGKRVWL